jgi:hypothetical protein
LSEKRLDPQILIHAVDFRGIDLAVGLHRQPTVLDSFAGELGVDRSAGQHCPLHRSVTNSSQVTCDLVGQHLLQSQAEQVWGVAAVGPCEDITTAAGRAARAPVTGGTAVGQPGDDRGIALDVAFAVVGPRTDSLRLGEFALEELPTAHDRTEWIARAQKTRRIRGEDVAATGTDLFLQGLVNAGADRVRRLCEVALLSARVQA